MAQFVSPFPDIEVLGQSLQVFYDALSSNSAMAPRLLARHGIRKLDPQAWYPIQPYLDMYREVADTIGQHTLYNLGRWIPERAAWPPQVTTFDEGMAAIDVAYHMNHRRGGAIMYDASTQRMLEGIGHYAHRAESSRRHVVACDTPYPAEFDRGIVTAMARKFKPAAEVARDPSKPSRLSGGDSCTFIVTW